MEKVHQKGLDNLEVVIQALVFLIPVACWHKHAIFLAKVDTNNTFSEAVMQTRAGASCSPQM